ncbi:class I tRNA ligase family protein [Candidatus Nomurabacteria bacterium]|nr:class I tRNA ligase family protein [Candidatus Nomurabacteria bacterium]
MKSYDHKKIEKKWQQEWNKKKIYKTTEGDKTRNPKYYVLDMFPYPSGEGLHVGHPKGYIATDVISRMKRMQGFNVLHPMGFDAFGLPAENFALKMKIHPEIAVKKNIKRFKEQLGVIGLDYDWSREVNTTDPKYYKWTQWIFLQLFKKGLAYESHEPINWCPSCKTGLANEDLEGGKCERCGSLVEKKPLRQWVLKITDYAERLLTELDLKNKDGSLLLSWPESIKEMQRHWIGKSEGMLFEAPVKDTNLKIQTFSAHFEAFTADTFVVIAPDHPFLKELVKNTPKEKEVLDFSANLVKERLSDGYETKEVKGIFTGRYIVDPVGNGDLPIWVASYALADYGTGIVKCSAHDERDFVFAKKYNIKLKKVIEPLYIDTKGASAVRADLPFVEREAVMGIVKHWQEDKYLGLKWKQIDWGTFVTGGIEPGQTPEEAIKAELEEETGYFKFKSIKKLGRRHAKFYHPPKKENRFGHFNHFYLELESGEQKEVSQEEKDKHEVVWLSKDEVEKFLVSEGQRDEWHELQGKEKVVLDGILTEPKELAGREVKDVREDAIKYLEKNNLAKRKTTYKLRDWVFSRQRYWGEPIPLIHCEKCGVVPVPEKDLPVKLPKVKFYEPTGTGESPLAAISKWVNVKCPKCKGKAKRETNTMPQWAGSSWYYLRFMDSKNPKALVDKKKEKYWNTVDLYVGGAEHATRHLIYARFWHKFLLDIGIVSTEEPFRKLQSVGLIMGPDGRKMSKRFGNIINPDDIVNRYGADTLRLYEMFMGPFDQAIAWSEEAIIGPRRFLERVWKIAQKVSKNNSSSSIEKLLNKTIKKVSVDIVEMRFNTAISSMMILVSEMEKAPDISLKDYKKFIQILAPFAPHLADEIWKNLGEKKSINLSVWPKWDEKLMKDEDVKIVVQVNGKVRAEIVIAVDAKEDEIKKLASVAVSKYLTAGEIKKVIYIKNRLVNIVV